MKTPPETTKGTTGNTGLDALADAIAQRVLAAIRADREPAYIDARECARRMGRSARSVLYMASKGSLPSVRQGNRVMFRWPDVQAVIES